MGFVVVSVREGTRPGHNWKTQFEVCQTETRTSRLASFASSSLVKLGWFLYRIT